MIAGCGSNDSPVSSGRGLHCVHHDHTGRSKCALHGESTQPITLQAHQGGYLGYVALSHKFLKVSLMVFLKLGCFEGTSEFCNVGFDNVV